VARLSMGLPVYNGERFLPQTLEAILAQTFTDFELAIVDNASTDGTAAICQDFARRDRRVRYHLNERNIGGGPNWNRAFEMSAPAPYFKWVAHDDIYGPAFLERCVSALDADPGAVLAFTRAEFVDEAGQTIAERKSTLPLDSPDVVARFEALFTTYDCLEIFGVMRREHLQRRPVMGQHVDGDGVLLANLALRGRFIEVPELLFWNRRHAKQAGTKYERDHRAWSVWWNPDNANRRVFPVWRRYLELWRGFLDAPLPPRDRLRCARALARWTRWRRRRLFEDLTYYLRSDKANRESAGS
jgi:glycosyltransferase involved in cell wall biosynthesis